MGLRYMFSLHIKERTQRGWKAEQESEQTDIAAPSIEKAREKREDHLFASPGAYPCHQLRAHKSRKEEHKLWMALMPLVCDQPTWILWLSVTVFFLVSYIKL